MANFHISEDGNPRACRAQPGNCKLSKDAPHYNSKEEASAAYEKQQEAQVPVAQSGASKSSKPEVALDKDLPEGAENLPDLPDGRSFVTAFNERFSDLREWQKETGKERPAEMFKDMDSLLDDEVYALHEESRQLITADQYREATGIQTSSDYVVQVYTKQGTKWGRECYCDDYSEHEENCSYENVQRMQEHRNHVIEMNDEDDASYANFYFDGGITKEQGDEFLSERSKLLKLQADANKLEKMKSGQLTPWAAIKDPNADAQAGAANLGYNGVVIRAKRDKANAEAAVQSNKVIAEVSSKIKSGKVTAEDLNGLRLSAYERKRIVENGEALISRRAEAEKFREMLSEAEALTDGPVKEYLIGDRGSFNYETTEQQGRRKVKVKKVGQYGSRLGSDAESAESSLKFVEASSARDIALISKPKADNDAAIERYKETVKELPILRSQAWAADWYGDPQELPPVPKDF